MQLSQLGHFSRRGDGARILQNGIPALLQPGGCHFARTMASSTEHVLALNTHARSHCMEGAILWNKIALSKERDLRPACEVAPVGTFWSRTVHSGYSTSFQLLLQELLLKDLPTIGTPLCRALYKHIGRYRVRLHCSRRCNVQLG